MLGGVTINPQLYNSQHSNTQKMHKLVIITFLIYFIFIFYGDLSMEVALMALGVGFIIASFEIHFRYLQTAKEYYTRQLDSISIELEEFLKKKKPSRKDQLQLSQFLKGLNKLLEFCVLLSICIFHHSRFIRA